MMMMILAWSVQDFDFVKCSLTCYSVYSRGMHSVVELTRIKAVSFTWSSRRPHQLLIQYKAGTAKTAPLIMAPYCEHQQQKKSSKCK